MHGVGGWGKIQILIWIKKEFYFKTYFFVLISSITFAKILNFYELELRRKMYFVIMIKDVLDCVFLGQRSSLEAVELVFNLTGC